MTVTNDAVQDSTKAPESPIREGQDREGRPAENIDAPRYYLRNQGGSCSGATPPNETQDVTDRPSE